MNFKSDWIHLMSSGIEGRGRNGYFKLAHIYVSTSDVQSRVAFYSSRIGNSPPMMLISDNPENLRAALQQALEKLDEIIDHSTQKNPDPAALIQAAQIVGTDEALEIYKEAQDAADEI